jgi:hypothetical protein
LPRPHRREAEYIDGIDATDYHVLHRRHDLQVCGEVTAGEGFVTLGQSLQQRPPMLYQRYFRGEYVFMEKDGRTRMLLVSLLGNKRLETSGSAILDRLFP